MIFSHLPARITEMIKLKTEKEGPDHWIDPLPFGSETRLNLYLIHSLNWLGNWKVTRKMQSCIIQKPHAKKKKERKKTKNGNFFFLSLIKSCVSADLFPSYSVNYYYVWVSECVCMKYDGNVSFYRFVLESNSILFRDTKENKNFNALLSYLKWARKKKKKNK